MHGSNGTGPTSKIKAHGRLVTAFGESKLLSHWPKDPRCRVSFGTLVGRLNSGWPAEQALTEEPRRSTGGATKKPKKPGKKYPLFPHANGSWARKIGGRLCYFGPWSDPDAALRLYNEQRADLEADRRPRTPSSGLTVRELANRFLTYKESRVDSGELNRRTFEDYHRACKCVIDEFGKDRGVGDLDTDDFAQLRMRLAKRFGAKALSNMITWVRSVFKYASDNRLTGGSV